MTSVETIVPEVPKDEPKDKEPKDKPINIMEEEDDGFDHINANINEGLNDEQVIYRIKEGFINEDSNSESKSILKI